MASSRSRFMPAVPSMSRCFAAANSTVEFHGAAPAAAGLRTRVAFAALFPALLAVIGLSAAAAPRVQGAPDDEVLTQDSLPQPGVAKGRTFDFVFDQSQAFPGTTRKISVYVPAAYTADKPACVYLGLDGLGVEVSAVFDNLIEAHEMPVTIAIGIEPGTVPSSDAPANPRYDRSVEFDGLSDGLARFVLEEILPAVQRHRTPDGRVIRLSADPNDRAVGGASSGAIGAFTLAWQRPDAFRRVFSSIGSFIDMRGGDRYATLVRKTEPKPLRIFMQDGSRDELEALGEMGDWWLANQTMNSALEFSGYQVRHAWGDGNHNPRHGAKMFPDAMRWLWAGWPQPLVAGESQNVILRQIVLPETAWERVTEDSARSRTGRSPRGYHVQGPAGRDYQTDSATGRVWLTTAGGRHALLDAGLKGPTGIALSPDGLWLSVAENKSHWGYNYRVGLDGTVRDKQRYYRFHVPDEGDDSGAGAWVMDREGRLYAATRLGVQVFDRNGRVRAILPVPPAAASDVNFGGENLQYLYVTGGDGTVYRRKFKVPGAPPVFAPIVLPPWGPG